MAQLKLLKGDYWVLLSAGGVERTGGDGCFNAGCRTALGVGAGEGCLMMAEFIEVLSAGLGLIVTSASGIGVAWFRRNKERMAMTGTMVKSRIRTSPSRVIRRWNREPNPLVIVEAVRSSLLAHRATFRSCLII